MPRYYAHTHPSTSSNIPPHSFVFQPISDEDTVQNFVDAFLADHASHYPTIPILVDTSSPHPFSTPDDEPLDPSDPLSLVLEDLGDVFIRVKPQPAPPASAVGKKASPSTTASTAVEVLPVALSEGERAAAAQLEEATKAHSEGRLRRALQLYEAVLTVTASLPLEREVVRLLRKRAFSQSGVVHLINRRYPVAQQRLEKAVQLTSVTYRLVTPSSPVLQKKDEQVRDDAELFTLLAKCHLHLKDWDEADLALTKARELLASIKGKGVQAAVRDLDVLHAQALLDCGDQRKKQEGLQLIESLIASNDQHVPTLVRYAKVAIDGGQTLPTIPYLLRAVVNLQQKSKHPTVDEDTQQLVYSLFAAIVSKPNGVETLFTDLGQAANMPQSLLFIAQTLKDQSAIAPSIACYRRAIERTHDADVEKAGIVLNLVHTLEVNLDYNEAWKTLRGWMEKNQKKQVGEFKVGQFWKVLEPIVDIQDSALLTGTASYAPQWVEIPAPADEGQVQVAVPTVDAAAPVVKGQSTSSAIRPHAEYSNEALNILALMFTAVKMLFVCGALQPIPALIALIEPLRVHKQLHLTLIRNEHAYHSTIAQLLRTVQFPLPIIPPAQHIYVCGDSHCLSSAWRIIHLPTPSSPTPIPHLLRPLLTTGTKIWHLRPTCSFYPHANYESAIRLLPTRSTVILSFGEIDCREGLLVAVEKGKYDGGLPEAITATINIYEKEWDRLAGAGHKVWVHPVQPVLDVTRPVVKQFEAALRTRVKGREEKRVRGGKVGKGEVHYLQLFDDLLLEDGGFNAAEYGMDGTHIHPRYTRLIEREMTRTSPSLS